LSAVKKASVEFNARTVDVIITIFALADLMLGGDVAALNGVTGDFQVSSSIHSHLWSC